jgi:hypothetical protein
MDLQTHQVSQKIIWRRVADGMKTFEFQSMRRQRAPITKARTITGRCNRIDPTISQYSKIEHVRRNPSTPQYSNNPIYDSQQARGLKMMSPRTARLANRFYSSMELPQPAKQQATNIIGSALSMTASASHLSTPPMSPSRRNRSFNNKPLKGRMTIEEVKAALEPITRAREEQSLMRDYY